MLCVRRKSQQENLNYDLLGIGFGSDSDDDDDDDEGDESSNAWKIKRRSSAGAGRGGGDASFRQDNLYDTKKSEQRVDYSENYVRGAEGHWESAIAAVGRASADGGDFASSFSRPTGDWGGRHAFVQYHGSDLSGNAYMVPRGVIGMGNANNNNYNNSSDDADEDDDYKDDYEYTNSNNNKNSSRYKRGCARDRGKKPESGHARSARTARREVEDFTYSYVGSTLGSEGTPGRRFWLRKI